MNHCAVIISGASGTGKTTLVNKLQAYYSCSKYSPYMAYYDIAKKEAVPIERAFVDVSQKSAERQYLNVCMQTSMVIGDQHLAIQFERDSKLALNMYDIGKRHEPFIGTLRQELIASLQCNGILTFVIHLYGDANTLLVRTQKRLLCSEQPIRNHCIHEVEDDLYFEKQQFDIIRKRNKGLITKAFDCVSYDADGVYTKAVQLIDKYRHEC